MPALAAAPASDTLASKLSRSSPVEQREAISGVAVRDAEADQQQVYMLLAVVD